MNDFRRKNVSIFMSSVRLSSISSSLLLWLTYVSIGSAGCEHSEKRFIKLVIILTVICERGAHYKSYMQVRNITWQKRFWRGVPLSLVLIVLLVVTLFAAYTSQRANKTTARARLDDYAQQVSNELIYRQNDDETLRIETRFTDAYLAVYRGVETGSPIYSAGTEPRSRDVYVSKTTILKNGDRQWTIHLVADSAIVQSGLRKQPIAILVVGALFSVLLYMFLVRSQRSRSQEMEYETKLAVETTKEELLSLASHQLRTPATGVKQYIGMLLQGFAGDLSEEQVSLLQKAYDANERQLSVINQILHITRIENGSLEMNSTVFNIGMMLHDVVDEQQEAIETRQHSVQVSLPRRPVMYRGDEFYLRMVFENLLSNAVKYTHTGGHIQVALQRRQDHITIAVSDNGVGMTMDEQSRLFQRFARIDNELSIEAGGSGIGLYLAQKIVALHGGTIEVQSVPGDGTTFTVILPKNKKIHSFTREKACIIDGYAAGRRA